MTNKPGVLHFQIIQSNIDLLYMRLGLSLNNILKMVEQENDFKGFYNPKKQKIVNCDDVREFTKFQSTIKGLNNYIYYNSLILTSYSVFEHSLKLICNFIDNHYTLTERFDDKHNDILGNCIKFLKGTLLVNLNDEEIDKIFMHIKNVNKLRNLIAHNNGNLIKDKSKPIESQSYYNFLKLDKLLIIIGNGQVYVDNDEYIRSFVEESEKFLNLIIKQLNDNC
jgi:hypothetical protein